jgi:hypothetical protein
MVKVPGMRRQAKLHADMGFAAPHLSDRMWQSVDHQVKSIRQKNIGRDHQARPAQRQVPDANHFHVGAVQQINKSNKIAYIDARRLSTVVMGPHGEHKSAYQGPI